MNVVRAELSSANIVSRFDYEIPRFQWVDREKSIVVCREADHDQAYLFGLVKEGREEERSEWEYAPIAIFCHGTLHLSDHSRLSMVEETVIREFAEVNC